LLDIEHYQLVYMPRTAAIYTARSLIERYFNKRSSHVFLARDIKNILIVNRRKWKLPESFSTNSLISFLLEQSQLREIVLTTKDYGSMTRYTWGDFSLYELALSIRPGSYLSHFTAAFLNNLTDQIPKIIYVNYEQSPKPTGGNLSQESIDRAFANRPRLSNLIYLHDNAQIVIVSGKYTRNLEVGKFIGPYGENLLATKLERTLIDLVVRPAYSGGLPSIIDAYRTAKDRVSINVFQATLKQLNYIYPYHQAIGFIMERAGFQPEHCKTMFDLGTKFDFYLAHHIDEKDYDPKWRLFFPKGL
jgi:hypothetical protein